MSGSATLARTTTPQTALSGLTLAQNGVASTAFELAVAKTGLLADADALRISLAQPLHVEDGALDYTSIEVTDRETGAVGPFTQTWNISGNREVRLEAMYSIPVLDGRADVDAFGLADLNPPSAPDTRFSMSAGAQFRIGL